MERKLASNTDTKVSALDYLSICFLCGMLAIAHRENTTEESAPRGAEKVNKRSNSAHLHCEFQSVALLKATALGCFF